MTNVMANSPKDQPNTSHLTCERRSVAREMLAQLARHVIARERADQKKIISISSPTPVRSMQVMVELEREIWSSQDLEQIEIRSPPNGERSGNGRSFGDSRQTMGLDFSAFGRTSSRNTEPFRTASATSVSSASSEDGWGRRNHVGERERRWPPSTSTRGLGQR